MAYVPLAGILIAFLLDILLNAIIIVSPCSAPWMVAAGTESCTLANGAWLVESLISAAIMGISGLTGLLRFASSTSSRNTPLGTASIICLAGGFLKLMDAWMYS